MLDLSVPEWEPLLNLAADHVDDFMWMYVVELDDGTRIQAYEHRWSRRYLFLGENGLSYKEVGRFSYREAGSDEVLLDLLEAEVAEFGCYSVRHNEPEAIQLKWARSATKHRISRQRSQYVIERCGIRFVRPARENGRRDPRILFLGDDHHGVRLEVIAVEERRECFLVIHAMELRTKYQGLYERGRKWRRT